MTALTPTVALRYVMADELCRRSFPDFLTFAKIHPFLAELRVAAAEPEFCRHLEAVVLAAPDAETIMARRRAAALAAAKRRAGSAPPDLA